MVQIKAVKGISVVFISPWFLGRLEKEILIIVQKLVGEIESVAYTSLKCLLSA